MNNTPPIDRGGRSTPRFARSRRGDANSAGRSPVRLVALFLGFIATSSVFLGLGLTATSSASTVAPTPQAAGVADPASVAVEPGTGDLFIANKDSNSIIVVPQVSGTVFGQSVTAGIPTALAAASSIAGPPIEGPYALAFDTAGNLYIANFAANDEIGSITVLPAISGDLFDGQPVTANIPAVLSAATGIDGPDGLVFDSNGDLLISNWFSDSITVVPATSDNAQTPLLFGQSFTPGQTTTLQPVGGSLDLSYPENLIFDGDGNLYIADSTDGPSGYVTVVPASGGMLFGQTVEANTPTPITALSPTPPNTTSSPLEYPFGLAFDSSGDLLVSNEMGNDVTVLPAAADDTLFGQTFTTADEPTTLAPSGGALSLSAPFGIAFDSTGADADLFIANQDGDNVVVVPGSSQLLYQDQSVTANQPTTLNAANELEGPDSVAIDASGNLYVANQYDNTVSVVPATSGTLFNQPVTAGVPATLSAASGLGFPDAVAVDQYGDLFIANSSNTVLVLTSETRTIFGQSIPANTITQLDATADGTSDPPAPLNNPGAIAFDASGDLFIANDGTNADPGQSVIVVPASTTTSIFGQSVTPNDATPLTTNGLSADLSTPEGLTFDNTSGDLFIGESGSNAVTVIPNSSGNAYGQSLTANTATSLTVPSSSPSALVSPWGLALDASGDVYVANSGGDSVTELAVDGSGASTVGLASYLSSPEGLATDTAGDLFIQDASTLWDVVSPSTTTNPTPPAPTPPSPTPPTTTSPTPTSGSGGGGSTAPTPVETSPAPTPPAPTPTPAAPTPTIAPPPGTMPPSFFGTPASVTVSAATTTSVSLTSGGATAKVSVPAGALPDGTILSIYPISNISGITASIPTGRTYVLSFAVSWESLDGTSPNATTPITMVITDPSIQAGDAVYLLTSSGLEQVGLATVNGSVTIEFSSDPVFVVSAVPKLAVTKSKAAISASLKTVTVTLRCGVTACDGSASLTMLHRSGKREVRLALGTTRVAIGANTTRNVRINLTKADHAALRRTHGRVGMTLSMLVAGGSSTTHPVVVSIG